MLRRLCLALTSCVALAAPAAAQDAAEQAFIDYHTARAIDAQCHFLRYFELSTMRNVELNLLAPLWFTAAHDSGKIDDGEYLAAYEKLAEAGRAKAADIDCADQAKAAPFILKLRELTAILIYSDLIIAFDGNGLSDEQRQAAQIYEAMISPLYGETWPRFVDYARSQAQIRYNQAAQKDDDSNPLAGMWDDDPEMKAELEAYGLTDDGVYVEALRKDATRIIDDMLFDLTAGEAGYRVRSAYLPNDTAIDLMVDGTGTTRYELIDIPGAYETLEGAGPVNLIFASTPEGELLAMTWGENARTLLASGSLTVLANPNKLTPEQTTSFSYIRSQDWLDDARIFTAQVSEETCIGGPCFVFPKEALDTILAGSANQSYRFFVSSAANPAMPMPDNNQIQTGFTYILHNWMTYKSSQ